MEATTLLVTVQGIPAARYINAGAGYLDEQGFQRGIVLDGEQLARYGFTVGVGVSVGVALQMSRCRCDRGLLEESRARAGRAEAAE
jgi:hypothetical protein